MKRLRLSAERLKLLAEVAEQRRDRGRYLVLRRGRYPGRGSRRGRGGLGERRTNTGQILGRTLDQIRRCDQKRHFHALLGLSGR